MGKINISQQAEGVFMSLLHLRGLIKGKKGPHLKALTPCQILCHWSVFASTVN